MTNPLVFSPPLVFGSVIDHLQLNALDVFVSQSINGVTGGVIAPAAPIVIGGSGLQVTGDFQAASVSSLAMAAASSFTVPATAVITLIGNQIINSGAVVQWQNGSFLTMVAGSTATLGGTTNAGGTVNLSGTTNLGGTPQLTGGTTLGISPARAYQRARVSLLEVDTTIWARSTPESDSWPLLALQAAFTVGTVPERIAYEVDVPDGATITSVSAAIKGAGAAHVPAAPPKVYMHKINLATGAQTLVGMATDSVTDVVYITNHDITITPLAEVVDRTTYQYVVRIEGEGAAGGVLGLRICAPRVFFTRAKAAED